VADRFFLPAEPAVYPELELSADVLRRAMWSGGLPRKRPGVQARIGYWEWGLSYNPTAALCQIEEFFAAHDGPLAFLYRDTNDSLVKGQYLGAGNGNDRRFRLVHKVAEAGDIVMVEPIGAGYGDAI
jgi:hypothetical protein